MKRISTARDAKCAAEKFCFPLNGKRETKQKWLDNHDLFVAEDGKVLVLVDTVESVYFMDAITGSLYQFGNCLTSNVLKTSGVKRNRDAATSYLMNKRLDGSGDDSDSMLDVESSVKELAK